MPRTTPAQIREMTRAAAAFHALREIAGNTAQLETFARALVALELIGARAESFRALADEIDAAYRAQALANAKEGNR